jgi:glyoxylase-like metal-dependent hydrolase (beta-lactamase superfamily II)
VAPGVLRMQLPISLPGLGHVNCYALEDERGWTVIDPGLPSPESFVALRHRLQQVGATPDDVHTVVVTHSHPDHFGGAGRLRIAHHADVVAHELFRTVFDPRDDDSVELDAVSDAPAARITGADVDAIRDLLVGEGEIGDLPVRPAPWGGTLPLPSRVEFEHMRQWDDLTKRGFMTPQPTVRVADAQVMKMGRREWVAIHTPGHTGDHLCFFEPNDGILLSGDHVLPSITPHISGLTPSPDSLADFFAALAKVAALDGVDLVLPAHGDPFTDLVGRTDAIARHHHERLATLGDIGRALGEADVIEFSHHLFRERSWGSMAESETYAHLEHLRLAGRAERQMCSGQLCYRILADGPGIP